MPLSAFEQRVRRAIQHDALLPPACVVVVACSGGADSLALLLALHALCGRPEARFPAVRLHVAHLNHGLRPEAAQDAAFVTEICRQRAISCTVEEITERESEGWTGSLEAAARAVRYRFLRSVAQAVGADCIALGHTMDDQAETVLMHFLRGSGLDGLSGMRARSGDLIRPLLGLRHADTRTYCRAQGVTPREDPSNADLRFTRNRLRHELLPLLETFQPQIIPTLARNAAVIAEDADFLDHAADLAWDACLVAITDDAVTLSRAALRAQPPALRHRVLRRAILRAGSPKPDAHLNADSLARLDRVILDRSGERRTVQLSTGAIALCDREHAMISLPSIHQG